MAPPRASSTTLSGPSRRLVACPGGVPGSKRPSALAVAAKNHADFTHSVSSVPSVVAGHIRLTLPEALIGGVSAVSDRRDHAARFPALTATCLPDGPAMPRYLSGVLLPIPTVVCANCASNTWPLPRCPAHLYRSAARVHGGRPARAGSCSSSRADRGCPPGRGRRPIGSFPWPGPLGGSSGSCRRTRRSYPEGTPARYRRHRR